MIFSPILRALFLIIAVPTTCQASWVLNNPYPESASLKNIYYSSFNEQPKTLDPARSYSSNEYQFITQIYEPIVEYDYYKRPYQLVPLTAANMPAIRYLDKNYQTIAQADNGQVAFTVYTIHIKPGILFAPHPAFAKDKLGHFRYLNLSSDYLEAHDINQLSDFKYMGTRELVADDYLYQIKRLAHPSVTSPIYGLMSEHIVGFRDFASILPPSNAGEFINLNKYPLAGIRKLDKYTFEITLYQQYAQFMYWLAMPFFAPIPWEADKFYAQDGMNIKNLSFDWYPVGTGPFMLSENNPNRRMILLKNPNYRLEYFPTNGSQEDKDAGFMHSEGHLIPLIDKAIYTLEKESIPRWNKFLQGYYDISGISADSFFQAIQISPSGTAMLSKSMQNQKMHLTGEIDPSIYYMGFNMLDPIVGGTSERARKLRLAISIAVNFDEHISIFYNGRGKAAQGPIPQGIFGYKKAAAGINPYVYFWQDAKQVRRSINEAKKLLIEAGYPQGHDLKTGNALILHYDVPATSGPDDKARLDWMRKQFAKIGIDLNVRATQYNRFQEKVRSGNVQIFSWAWNADYPDPENFLFLLYGANGKVLHGGENSTNYNNPTFDKLFDLMKNRSNDETRQQLIDQMVALVRHDAPWVWGMNSETLTLNQNWVAMDKPNPINLNQLKYRAIDVAERDKFRKLWNKPILWPLGVLFLLIILLLVPLLVAYYQKEKCKALRIKT